MLDGNTAALHRHLNQLDISTKHRDEALTRANEEFWAGELDGRIQDLVVDEPVDALMIALYTQFGSRNIPISIHRKDFCATVNGVINDRADEIYEELSE